MSTIIKNVFNMPLTKNKLQNFYKREVVIHMDYSENLKKKQQNEIKAGCYGQGQFSLFSFGQMAVLHSSAVSMLFI